MLKFFEASVTYDTQVEHYTSDCAIVLPDPVTRLLTCIISLKG